MKNILLPALLLVMTFPHFALAHEGHDELPGKVSAPKGGIIRPGHGKYFEALVEPGQVHIYAYDEKLQVLRPENLKISATLTRPRAKQSEKVSLDAQGDHWTLNLKGRSDHRLTLKIEDLSEKKTTTFILEPKRPQ